MGEHRPWLPGKEHMPFTIATISQVAATRAQIVADMAILKMMGKKMHPMHEATMQFMLSNLTLTLALYKRKKRND